MTGGFTRSVWLGSEGGEVGAAGGLTELPGVDGNFGADGMAGAMRAVVSARSGAGGNGLDGAGGVATVGALLGVPPGFNATGGPGGGGGVDAGLANRGGGIFEVSGGDDLGGTGDLMIALPGFNVGAGAIIVEPAEGGFSADASGVGGFKLVSAPIVLLFSKSELVVMVLPVSTSIEPGFGLRSWIPGGRLIRTVSFFGSAGFAGDDAAPGGAGGFGGGGGVVSAIN